MIKEQRLVFSTVIVLTVLGTLLLFVHIASVRRSSLGRGESMWRLTYDVEVPKGAKTSIAVPNSTAHCRVCRESFSLDGLWMDMVKSKRTRARDIVVVPIVGSNGGRLAADFDIHLSEDKRWKVPATRGEMTADEVSHYLREESTVQLAVPEISQVVAGLKAAAKSKSELLQAICDYCLENVVNTGLQGATDAATTVQRHSGASLGHVRTMLALCRAANIPARLVCGIMLKTQRELQVRYWVEVWVKKGWRPYDPVNGYRAELPPNFVPIRFDDDQIVRTAANTGLRARFSVRRITPSRLLTAPTGGPWPTVADLTRLSPGMQAVVALVLLLPIGALLTALFRNLVGIETFGTFAPSLIAISFVQADWRTGAVVFFLVLGIGILARLFLNRLKLLMVARLGVILTLVVVTMIAGISVLDYLGLTPSASAALLPMVILTMMVERFNITVEEDGHREAFRTLAGTLMVAIACLLVLRWDRLSRLVLVFPELLLFVAGALLLIGRYSGYRLTELWRFRDMATAALEEP